MHSRDRHRKRPLRRWAIILVILFAAYTFSPALPSRYQGYLWVVCVFVAVFAPVALTNILVSRYREQLRARAIAGDTTAMPPTLIQPNHQMNSEMDAHPLVLAWSAAKQSASITASSSGLHEQGYHRQDVLIPWSEIRLFEITTAVRDAPSSEVPAFGYCIYGANGDFIEWPRRPPLTTTTNDPSYTAFCERQDTLLGLIASKAHLPLRTLNPYLAIRDETVLPGTTVIQRIYLAPAVLGCILGLAIALGIAVFSLTLPLTHVMWLNIYMSMIALVLATWLAFLTVRLLHRFFRSVRFPPPVNLPAVATPMDSQVSIEPLRSETKWLATLTLGTFFASAIYPLLYAIRGIPEDQSITNLRGDLWFVVFCVLVIGWILFVLSVYDTFRSHQKEIRVEAGGLYEMSTHSKRHLLMPWCDVMSVKAKVASGYPTAYEVVGNGMILGWPAHARWVQPPEGASTDDVGAQFAAIVAQRAGVQPTTEWA